MVPTPPLQPRQHRLLCRLRLQQAVHIAAVTTPSFMSISSVRMKPRISALAIRLRLLSALKRPRLKCPLLALHLRPLLPSQPKSQLDR